MKAEKPSWADAVAGAVALAAILVTAVVLAPVFAVERLVRWVRSK